MANLLLTAFINYRRKKKASRRQKIGEPAVESGNSKRDKEERQGETKVETDHLGKKDETVKKVAANPKSFPSPETSTHKMTTTPLTTLEADWTTTTATRREPPTLTTTVLTFR